MKSTIALSFAFSMLAAGSAFASPSTQSLVKAVSTPVAERIASATPEVQVAGAGNKTFDRASLELNNKVVVAENRKEFGSQYQRY